MDKIGADITVESCLFAFGPVRVSAVNPITRNLIRYEN